MGIVHQVEGDICTDDQSFHYYAVTIHKSPRVVTSTEDLLYGTTAFYRILHHLPSQEGKCDRTEPVCNRCVKAGLECPGYKQVMRMQQHFVGRGGGLIRAPGGVSTLERPEVPRSLSLAGFEGQIAFSFYFRDYRWAYFWQGILQTSPVGNTDLSYKASLAVATGYLVKAKKDLDLESKATELSSVAVKAVQFTLDRGLKSDFPGLLAVITALGVYNYVVDNKFHYLHHYGAQMIMKTCGPGYFQ